MMTSRIFVCLMLLIAGCAPVVSVQPQVNSFVAVGQYDRALNILDEKGGYGGNNTLLYALDRGLVAQYAGEYAQSIESFTTARQEFQALYTRSVARASLSWVWNDSAQPYYGDDFERVLANAFQSLNFAVDGDYDDALVEMRDADGFLGAVESSAPGTGEAQKLGAFLRLLSGVMYEAAGGGNNLSQALVAYRLAAQGYEARGEEFPEVLKTNYLRVARQVDRSEAEEWQERTGAVAPDEPTAGVGTIYLVHYHGLSPVKREEGLTVPMPDRQFGRIAFPSYRERSYAPAAPYARLTAANGATSSMKTAVVEDIGALALAATEKHKLALRTKGIARPLAKYAAVEAAADGAYRRSRGAGDAVRIIGSLFNTFSERADLRSWQTLPGEIRLGRATVPPGRYTVGTEGAESRPVEVRAGETAFVILRTAD